MVQGVPSQSGLIPVSVTFPHYHSSVSALYQTHFIYFLLVVIISHQHHVSVSQCLSMSQCRLGSDTAPVHIRLICDCSAQTHL